MSTGIAKKAAKDWTNIDHQKLFGIINRAQTAKGIPTMTLCQKNQGIVKTKQKPITMGDKTTHRTLSP
jgi:hypothetical protein